MEFTSPEMELTLTPEAQSFIEEWRSPLPYIEARTSGSTGEPKLIRLAKSDMVISARATIDFFNLTPSSLLYLPLSPDYIAGKMQIVRALEAGCSLICEPPSNNPNIAADSGITISLLPLVPSQVRSLIDRPLHPHIDNIIIGGAPIDPALEKDILLGGLSAYATYGMTETCSHVALRRIGCEFYSALPGFSFSTDKRGCLVIHSSRMSFSSLVTNDIVTLHDSHSFSWIGRYDNIINSGGVKISPEEIEKLIAPCFPTDINFYATSRQSEKWGEELVIVISSNQVAPDLISTLRSLLGPLKAPKEIIFDSDMQFTPSRKIIRRKF